MGPIGAARVASFVNEYVLIRRREMADTHLDLCRRRHQDSVLMVESEAQELPKNHALRVLFVTPAFPPVSRRSSSWPIRAGK